MHRLLAGLAGVLLSTLFLPFAAGAADREIDPSIVPFPASARTLQLGDGLKLVDFSVSPIKPLVALLLKDAGGQQVLKFWNLESDKVSDGTVVDRRTRLTWVTWHPVDPALFFLGKRGTTNLILRADQGKQWKPIELLSTEMPIQRLVVGPRPFQTDYNDKKPVLEYRLFFAIKKGTNFAIDTISETGRYRYQVVGQGPQYKLQGAGEEFPPSELPPIKGSALPVGFHPAGDRLVWEDQSACFNYASYAGNHWGDQTSPLYRHELCKGELWMLPNGSGVLHWLPKQNGYTLYLDGGTIKLKQAESTLFNSLPIVTPDGKGVVGWLRNDGAETLHYEPTPIPLGDIANAWMFIENEHDRELLAKHGGMFRSLKRYEQLFQLYESELYSCGGYDESTPTRPYIVTTDIFWETAAAAYEGLFVMSEREGAIPAFWAFVAKANAELRVKPDAGRWQKVFATLSAMRSGGTADPVIKAELAKIVAASGQRSDVVGAANFDFANLKPRGHYTNSAEASKYFRAFRYFVQASDSLGAEALATLSPETRLLAEQWVRSYVPFIAAPRGNLIWGKGLVKPADYAREPRQTASVFPLSWGFDNEALFNTVYHENWPDKDTISGPGGPRFLPTSLDLAAIFGSRFAESVLEGSGEFARYPTLRARIGELRQQYGSMSVRTDNLYDRWLSALAVQWSDSVTTPGNETGKDLYLAKRLQTGLASWATLRHATVLVNERSAPECGEGGFEPIILQFPRGYVETDPATFEAIAVFFDDLARMVTAQPGAKPGSPAKPVRDGVLRRLAESAATVRQFKAIAEKELRNEALTRTEYEDIFYVGRAAEHNFLVFKSLMRPDLAIANPDPIPKVADVAGQETLLNVAVGEPMEWDFIYPALGRRMIGKGSVYSFYEFTTPGPISDAEWRARLGKQRRPDWVMPYMSNQELTCPARPPL